MSSHFWRSKVLVAFVIGLFSLLVFAETISSTTGSSSCLMAQGKGQKENGELNQAFVESQSTQVLAANKEEIAEQVKNAESQPQPTVREHETSVPQAKKKKKFPWLLVIAVTLVAGATGYILGASTGKFVKLTVTTEQISGTPSAGTYYFKKGTSVNYSYTGNIAHAPGVMLDGIDICSHIEPGTTCKGVILMDKDHILEAFGH